VPELMRSPTIKESEDRLLLQASSKSDLVAVKFEDSEHKVPGSFLEYIDRLVLPKFLSNQSLLSKHKYSDIYRREGFETNNALQIFESTKKQKD
jgi:hypothetical protein